MNLIIYQEYLTIFSYSNKRFYFELKCTFQLFYFLVLIQRIGILVERDHKILQIFFWDIHVNLSSSVLIHLKILLMIRISHFYNLMKLCVQWSCILLWSRSYFTRRIWRFLFDYLAQIEEPRASLLSALKNLMKTLKT